MSRSQVRRIFEEDPHLHISYSQLNSWLLCPQRYFYQYVENRPFERISSSLFMGTGIHTAIERFYRTMNETGTIVCLNNFYTLR